MDLILLGAPGAGKGTQAELIREWLPIPRVSSGDLFRANLSEGTPLGVQARGYMDRGELVPDEVTIAMVAERIGQEDCAEGVIFDGFPRTVPQAEALGTLLAEMGREINMVLLIDVPQDVLLARLGGRWTCQDCATVFHRLFNPEKVQGVCDVCGGKLGQRSDDTPETHLRRIQVYSELTEPLVDYYDGKGLLTRVDGELGIEAVQQALRQAVENGL